MIQVSKISLAILVLMLFGCRPTEPSSVQNNTEQIAPIHIVYGAPVGVEATVPVAWAHPTEVNEEDMMARNAMPVLSMGISTALFQSKSWEESVKNIDSYIEDSSSSSKLIEGYILDQMVIQYVLHYSDILESPGSNHRTETLRDYLNTLTLNRFPYPERIESIIVALGEELTIEETAIAARTALESHEFMSQQLANHDWESCPGCYDAMTKGENPKELELRTSAISNLKELASRTKD
ncbi:MAG: hypothetical protein O3B41_09460 [Bacteroidetes bacterium]|nr:hypothetical protein [Bacteroidota bacterium]